MKKVKAIFSIIGIVLIIVLASITLFTVSSCSNRQKIETEKWTTIEEKGEVIYIGPTEYVDDDYEIKELIESKYNWNYNRDSGEFDKIPRRKSIFIE